MFNHITYHSYTIPAKTCKGGGFTPVYQTVRPNQKNQHTFTATCYNAVAGGIVYTYCCNNIAGICNGQYYYTRNTIQIIYKFN